MRLNAVPRETQSSQIISYHNFFSFSRQHVNVHSCLSSAPMTTPGFSSHAGTLLSLYHAEETVRDTSGYLVHTSHYGLGWDVLITLFSRDSFWFDKNWNLKIQLWFFCCVFFRKINVFIDNFWIILNVLQRGSFILSLDET